MQRVISTGGKAVDESAIGKFATSLRGRLLRPGADGYDEARKVWNGVIDRRPALIVRCATAADALAAVGFAREHDLRVAVRGGGHNVAGLAVIDAGLVIDFSSMKAIQVDPARRTVRAEPGVMWGELDRETQASSLAVPGGTISTTGIAGLTLGGGFGWLGGKHGLTCDNLISANVVTADAKFVTAGAGSNADLLWGLRGGGGNFGVVTSFEYRAHPLGPIQGGMIVYPAAEAAKVLGFYRDFMAAAPDELTLYVAFVTAPEVGPAVALAGCYCGSPEAAERLLEPLRSFLKPAADLFGPTTYLQQQTMLDAGWTAGAQNYWKSTFLRSLTDSAIDAIVAHTAAITTPLSAVLMVPFNGHVRRAAPGDSAFAHRDDAFNVGIYARWVEPDPPGLHVQWARDFWRAMQPFSSGGLYVNEFSPEDGKEWVRDAYGANYDRLAALKKKYDPDNFFRLNQNIRPAV